MTKPKPIYLLAGGRTAGSMDEILDAVFSDIAVSKPLIAYVGAANGDDQSFFERMRSMLRRIRECRMSHVITASDDPNISLATKQLQSADAIFVSGGDVEAGMDVVNRSHLTSVFANLYSEGKLLFGVSAGSIMLAREWVRWSNPDDDTTAELFPCLGIAPVLCDTHGEGDDWVELKAAIALKSKGDRGYGITSGSCLRVMPNLNLTALSAPVAVFESRKASSARLQDMTP